MTGIPLFIAKPTGMCRLALRRFRHGTNDDGHLHDATVIIDDNAAVGPRLCSDDRVPHDDPRWPTACGCGEPFAVADVWQVNELDWYEGGGVRFAWGIGSWDGPPGAMIRTPWRDEPGRPPAWVVFLPNCTWWNTNDRASDPLPGGSSIGPHWNVTGTAPAINVEPSINDQSPTRPWHGWIRNGVMEPA